MANELSGLVAFVGLSTDRLVLTPLESLHRAIARRVFGALGPLSLPTRFVHDGISGVAYSAVRRSNSAASGVATAGIRLVTGKEFRILSVSRRGRAAVSAINALTGDVLDERRNDLAISMAVRQRSADVAIERGALRSAFPDATGRLAVFLHGLAETDEHWLGRAGDRAPFGALLRRDVGFTPVLVRYNTGLHISENGKRLSEMLEGLVEGWPTAVRDIALIGHSMGGLVARSSAHAGLAARRRWPSILSNVITLGAPHTGVPLEKLVHSAAWLLRRVPESKPLAEILDLRSAGIRDLRFGYVTEDDWRREDPERLLQNQRTEVTLPPGCTQTFITASLTGDPRHPLSRLGGDLFVRVESAAGRRIDGSVAVSADSVVHVGPLTHFDLLDHPQVYEHIRQALDRHLPGFRPRQRQSRPG